MAKEGHYMRPVNDTMPVHWVVDALCTGWKVCTFVPRLYQSYGRITHPAWRCKIESDKVARIAVKWAEIASERGRTAHPLMQWHQIRALPLMNDDVVNMFLEAGYTIIGEPDEGSLPTVVATALYDELLTFTENPETCWFGVWNGFNEKFKQGILSTNTIGNDYRQWHVFRGDLALMKCSLFESNIKHQSANLFWPSDRSWFVATDIDLDSTYIGGSYRLIERLKRNSLLETYLVYPEDDVSVNSDKINPTWPTLDTRLAITTNQCSSDLI